MRRQIAAAVVIVTVALPLTATGVVEASAPGADDLESALVAPLSARCGVQGRLGKMGKNAKHECAQKSVEALGVLYSNVKTGDIAGTYSALRSALDPRKALRSLFTPPDGKPIEWGSMTPEQFEATLDWISEDPSRLDAISGSGDAPYLNQGDANAYAGKVIRAARALIARQLGLPSAIDILGPGYNDPNYYTTSADIISMGKKEAEFRSMRETYAKAHPTVQLSDWTPLYMNNPFQNDRWSAQMYDQMRQMKLDQPTLNMPTPP